MSVIKDNNPSSDTSTKFSILDLKAQAVRLPVSKGAQILLSELLTWSGERGYCWWGTPAIAKDLNWSVSAVWRRATELKESGLLAVIPRPGRSNYWIPLPGRNRMERLQKELTPLAESRGPSYEKKREKLKRCTVPNLGTSTEQPPPSPSNVNAIKICPDKMAPLPETTSDTPLDSLREPNPVLQTPPRSEPPIRHKPVSPVVAPQPKTKAPITPEQIFLVDEIERVTGDTWSRGHFINVVRQTDEQTIYAALSVTREKMSLESGVNLGAYFTATVRGMTGLASLGGRPVADVMIQQSHSGNPTPAPPARPTPRFVRLDEPEPEPFDPESLKRGWRLHCRSAGVRAMLSLVQKCVPVSVDVGRLWVDVREAFPGVEESILINRFLDTVVTRMKHAERMGEARV